MDTKLSSIQCLKFCVLSPFLELCYKRVDAVIYFMAWRKLFSLHFGGASFDGFQIVFWSTTNHNNGTQAVPTDFDCIYA